MPVAPHIMKTPQLFEKTRAGAQARRAAGVAFPGDDMRFVEDNTFARWGSARKLLRSIWISRSVANGTSRRAAVDSLKAMMEHSRKLRRKMPTEREVKS